MQSLAHLQPMISNNKRIIVAESLIDFLKKPKKKKIIREEIIAFIEQEQKRSPLSIYETAIPVLANVIKQSCFITTYKLYYQDIVEELLYKEVDKYHFPVEMTQYILGYT